MDFPLTQASVHPLSFFRSHELQPAVEVATLPSALPESIFLIKKLNNIKLTKTDLFRTTAQITGAVRLITSKC